MPRTTSEWHSWNFNPAPCGYKGHSLVHQVKDKGFVSGRQGFISSQAYLVLAVRPQALTLCL